MASKSKLDMRSAMKHSTWKVGERVLCRYPKGEIYYEAKIISVSHKEKEGFFYKVHYQGWNSRYDEKILETEAESRFRPYTEEDAEKAKEDIKQALQQQKGKKLLLKKSPLILKHNDSENELSCTSLPSTISANTPLKKVRKTTDDSQRQIQAKKADEFYEQQKKRQRIETTEVYSGFMPLELTPELGNILKLDHYLIKDQFFLPILPASVSVFQIIEKYIKHLEEEALNDMEDSRGSNELPLFVNEEMECNIEFVLGIVDYFDASLAKQLLYDFERDRHLSYFQSINNDVSEEALNELLFLKSPLEINNDDLTTSLRMSRHYGLAHLLRLLVKFPEMISTMLPCNERTVKLIKQRLDRLMEFLHNDWTKFYFGQDDYKPASLQYMSRLDSFRKAMKINEGAEVDGDGTNKENVFNNFSLQD